MANSIYYNARAKALEANLLDYSKLTALVKCSSIFEVTKLLNAWQFLKGINVQSYADLLNLNLREEKEFLTFLKRSSPSKAISQFFLLKYDYFNLQSIYLQNALNKDLSTKFEGNYLISTLTKAVQSKNYKILSPQMQKCLFYVDNLFLENRQTGFVVDTVFRKSLYEEMLEVSKADKELFKYMNVFIDLKNIEMALRLKDEKVFQKVRLLGGSLTDKFFNRLIELSYDDILGFAQQTTYYSAIELIITDLKQGLSLDRFELMIDCFGQTYFDKFKYETSGNNPFLRYCFLKQTEIINLKIIFEGLNLGRAKKKILNELRRVYEK